MESRYKFVKSLKPKNLLLPLLLVSVMATGIAFLAPIFGFTGRWIVIALLAGYLLSTGSKSRPNAAVILALISYAGWCVLTAVWSELPVFSFTKACALVFGLIAALGGGYAWSTRHKTAGSLDFVWPYAALALLAGLIGTGGSETTTGLQLYAGSTGNANFLGFIVATSTPVVLWRLYRSWPTFSTCLLWIGVLFAYVVILYLTTSRSSYLIFAAIVGGFLVGLGARRVAVFAVAFVFAAVFLSIVATQLRDAIIQRNIYKWAGSEATIAHSRQDTWNDSYDGAVAGGWLGVGYGVSAGADASALGSQVSSIGYGREKGNSPLAVVEETGLVGSFFYAVLIVVMFRKLFAGFRSAPNREEKVLLGIVIGTITGLLVQSMFEAWWDSPGAPEFVVFWVMTGVGLGVARRARSRSAEPKLVSPLLRPAEA